MSKAELTGSAEVQRRLEQELARPVLALSAVTGQGLADLVRAVVEQLHHDASRGGVMRPNVVVDVGNTASSGGCAAPMPCAKCSLPPNEPQAWERQFELWTDARGLGLFPVCIRRRRDQLVQWLRDCGQRVRLLENPNDLPLRVLLRGRTMSASIGCSMR